jgi:hypothetical protein
MWAISLKICVEDLTGDIQIGDQRIQQHTLRRSIPVAA